MISYPTSLVFSWAEIGYETMTPTDEFKEAAGGIHRHQAQAVSSLQDLTGEHNP